MEKLALISSFCDTEEKKNVLTENLDILKNLNIDTLLISPIQIDEKIIKKCDYYFQMKDNPILKWPQRMYDHWFEIKNKYGKTIRLHRGLPDYGWAALFQLKKLIQIALTYDYDIFYPMIYDLNFDDTVIDEIISNQINQIYQRIDPINTDRVFPATLHFMCLDRNKMEVIEKLITLENYLKTNELAEYHPLNWTKLISINLSNKFVSDKIFYYENMNFFDYSKDSEYKLFIKKCDDFNENFSLVFYDINPNANLSLKINDDDLNVLIEDWTIIDTTYKFNEIYDIVVVNNGIYQNYTEVYSSIMRNMIYYK